MRKALVAVAACLAAAPLVVQGQARADIFFAATAISYGVDSQVTGSSLPVGAYGQGASPAAQAVLDSVGTSQGFAAALYPGAFVVSLPSLVNGVLGTTPVPTIAPDFPALVSSDPERKPRAEQTGPGYSLSSVSNRTATTASASEGTASPQQSGSSRTLAVARSDSGSTPVLSDATATVSGFDAGGVLRVGTVTTTAKAVLDRAGRLSVTSSIVVTGMTVSGMTVGFHDGQFVSPVTNQPVPGNPIAKELAQAGITVSYLGAQRLPNGVESPGVKVTLQEQLPSSTPVGGTYTQSYVLGRAIATISSAGAGGPAASGGSTSTIGSSNPTGSLPARGPANDTAMPASGSVLLSSGDVPSPSTGSTATIPPGSSRPRLVSLSPGASNLGTFDMYLVLLFAALLLGISAVLFRVFGLLAARAPSTNTPAARMT